MPGLLLIEGSQQLVLTMPASNGASILALRSCGVLESGTWSLCSIATLPSTVDRTRNAVFLLARANRLREALMAQQRVWRRPVTEEAYEQVHQFFGSVRRLPRLHERCSARDAQLDLALLPADPVREEAKEGLGGMESASMPRFWVNWSASQVH